MARPGSQAVGGYYKTPTHLLGRITSLVQVVPDLESAFLDPCAGDGEAVCTIAKSLYPENSIKFKVYACEMERSRYEGVVARRGHDVPWANLEAVHGDAFKLIWERKGNYSTRCGVQVLFLNPPYDQDSLFKRLEERFLHRFASCLETGGVLVFVVPYYALQASAVTLGTHFEDLHCFRFPGEDFDAFKQVVLIGTKAERPFGADEKVVSQVEEWARNADGIPELPENPSPVVSIPCHKEYEIGFDSFRVAPLDVKSVLSQYQPWHTTDRGGKPQPIHGIFPEGESITRTYPMAMPPRPAHIAAGVAAGVFNGARIEPDDSKSRLPHLLVKGVFDREFVSVDEKKNKDGETTGVVQVQQPKLVITALDLSTKKFHTIKSSADRSTAVSIDKMTTADLLASYGRSLMRVMLAQCPVLHDPSSKEGRIEIPELGRPLYKAQTEAVMASVKLLGGVGASKNERKRKAVAVLGEIGSGKSSVALATAHTIGAKRILVMCPPHLLQGWTEQCAAVLPWAKTKVLSTVSDVDELAEAGDETIVAIMSREAAKLGHAWASLAVRCPKCGAEVPPGDHAKTRYQCEARTVEPNDEMARDAYGMALRLFPVDPTRHPMDQIFRGLHHKRMREALKERPKSWESVRASFASLVEKYFDPKADDGRHELFMFLLTAIGDDQLIGECARKLYLSCADDSSWEASKPRERARDMLLLMKAGPLQDVIVSELKAMPAKEGYSYYSGPDTWARWATARDEIAEGKSSIYGFTVKVDEQGQVGFNKKAKGSLDAAFAALEKLSLLGKWKASPECGEFLYQAIPEPRRVALSPYLAKRFPNFFDVFVLDEQHEYSGDSSAQGFAAHRITNLGIPTIGLTGSVMGGYAESLFANQWALDPSFRKEFGRDQRNEFVRRYGYLKQLVEDKNKDTGKVVAYGSMSDRVERSARTIGNAPGVLPLFVLRYLLKMSVTLHKADLALDLPPRHDIVERIQPSEEQRKWLNHLQSALVSRIKKDQFTDKAGKLWGQLAELPSYLDRCTADVGNQDDGGYVIAYPESEGGQMVASAPPMKASEILPKERWMLDTIAKELAEGRRVMVMAWHVKLLPRLAWLIGREIGEKVPILDPAKVPTAKRQAWIDKEIVKKRHNVMVCNPVAIQTGLNNLVWFSSQIWMQNPGVNAITFRQATGRIDRIGQTKESRVYFPIYEGTTQEQLHKLLLHKVGVSMATDGLDAESAMQAAGVGESDGFSALSVGRQLYELLAA